MALKASAEGVKKKSKNSQKPQKIISKKAQDKVLPKADSVSLKKSLKKDKVKTKKLEKNLSSSKKELIKKSLVEKNSDKIVKLTKEVPTKVLKLKNSIAKVDTTKPVVKAKGDKKIQKNVKKENKVLEVKSKSEALVKSAKKRKAEETKPTVKKSKSTSEKVKNKSVKSKNLEKDSDKVNVKVGKKLKKQVPITIKPNNEGSKDEKAKDAAKKEIKSVKAKKVKKQPTQLVDSKNKEEIKNIKSKKRKLSKTKKKEEKPEISGLPPPRKEIIKFVKALLKYIENEEKNKKTLFDAEKPPVLLQVQCIKVPKAPLHQMRILLPHSMVRPTDDVALFVKDLKRGRRRDVDETIHCYEDILKRIGCTVVKTIIPINQVKTEYRQYEMRRKLLGSHDFFLVDGRISGQMAHLLGKLFREKRKLPNSVHMDKCDIRSEIDKALRKTSLEIHRTGDTSTVQIGTCSMSAEDLADNIIAVIEKLTIDYPGGWDNIRSLRIKTPLSIAIPIYLTLKSRNSVKIPRLEPKRPEAYKPVQGKLSTFTDDVHVTVKPDGSLKVVRRRHESDDEKDDDTDEGDEDDTEEENEYDSDEGDEDDTDEGDEDDTDKGDEDDTDEENEYDSDEGDEDISVEGSEGNKDEGFEDDSDEEDEDDSEEESD